MIAARHAQLVPVGLCVVLSLALAACNAGGTSPAPTATGTEACQVSAAKADLAQALGLDPGSVQLVKTEPTDWPDASLGCPERGVMYIQVVTPGCIVTLQADGKQYIYHTGGDRVVHCEEGAIQPPATGTPPPEEATLEPPLSQLVQVAKSDLARRLTVPVDDITVQSARAVQWRDSSLGCPKPGQGSMDVITPGFLIVLEAGGRAYEYHANQQQAVFCENPQPPLP